MGVVSVITGITLVIFFAVLLLHNLYPYILDWALISLSPPSTSVSSDFTVLCKCSLKIILTSLYLVEGLAWCNWHFTWWTDQLLSFSALTLLVGSSDP